MDLQHRTRRWMGRAAIVGLLATALATTGPGARAEVVLPCPSGWGQVPTPAREIPHREGLRDVTAIADNDVWAVGTVDDGGATLAEHFNGIDWQRVPTPNPVADRSSLQRVDASATNDVWAVGRAGDASLVLHSDGNRWSTVALPARADVVDIAAVGRDQAWAFGRADGKAATFRWDGSTWSQVADALPDDVSPRQIVASSPSNVWASATRYDGSFYVPAIEHWDGTAWHEVQLDRSVTGALQGFDDVSTSGPGDVWFAANELNHGVVIHYDGTHTTRTHVGAIDGLITSISGLSAAGPADVWAVGGQAPTTALQPYVAHWDGAAWTAYPPPVLSGPVSSQAALAAVDRAPGGPIWSVGATFLSTVATRRCDGPTGPQPDPVARLAGADRIGTALAVSRQGFPDGTATAVVLARSDGFADALGGTPLAVAKGGPLLITPSGAALDGRVLAEVRRILPAGRTVYLLGGTAALSTSVDAALGAAGYTVSRLQGVDRYATSVAIAHTGLGDPPVQLLATGRSFPDALAGGAAAAAAPLGGAVLLTDGSALSPVVATYLAQHPGTRYALGGPAAAVPATGATPLAGADRYATAALVASTLFPEPGGVVLAFGGNFPDALACGALAGRAGAPLLLTATDQLPASVVAYVALERVRLRVGIVLGGTAVVSDAVVGTLQWQLS